MWQIDNHTPFAAAQSWIRDRNGAETWLVVVKASFEIRPDGSTTIAPEQPEPVRTPEYRGDGPLTSSVLLDGDFVLTKRNTDILVHGSAHAPGGRPTRQMEVAVSVGAVHKTLRVSGDRVWLGDGVVISDPAPFVVMPLIYERAFGGVDRASKDPGRDWYWPNPVGTGFAVSRKHMRGMRLPNIEYPGDIVSGWDARPNPGGFGVIAANWKSRARFAGTYGDSWLASRQPLLPDDFDDRHYQSAPEDQQSEGHLKGGELVRLLNLTPSGHVAFVLPVLDLVFETRFKDGASREHPHIALHAVHLEPERSRVSLVLHSALECHADVYRLDRTIVHFRAKRPTPREEQLNDLLRID